MTSIDSDYINDDEYDTENESQTAMLLTEQEWRDLAEIVQHYLDTTAWVAEDPNSSARIFEIVHRKRSLAQRIRDAV